MIFMTIAAGITNGLAVATAIHIAGKLQPGSLHFQEFFLFISLMALFWYCKRYSINESTRLVENIVRIIRLRILGKLNNTDLLGLESIDKGIFFSALATDTATISLSTTVAINAISSGVMLSFLIIYIAVMSVEAVLITVGIVSFIVILYLKNEKQISGLLQKSAASENIFMDNLNGLLYGFKDLKLNRRKYQDFSQEELNTTIDASTDLRVDAGLKLNITILLSQSFLLFSISGILFLLPQIDQNQITLIPKLIALIIFTSDPVGNLATAIPAVSRAEAAINNIRKLENLIDQGQNQQEQISGEQPIKELSWSRICLENIFFQFPLKANGRPFHIGPMQLEFHRGEITFIVGGNGSGKSTFLKALTSLYPLDSGRILLDDIEITPFNKASYRNLFSTIFSDYYLFGRLIGIDAPDNEKIDTLLAQMELTHKTSIEDGVITNRDLSTGQKKRLSLIISVLEDKPVMIFDEWAADQDPVFRKFFYEVLLPELKAKGKTIIAVTHDDKYFHAADRIYKMEYGRCTPYELAA
nr:cyclic peptide export ABC transporter [Desulfobulbus rhabdoformis]